jgi:hypothetical protein
MKVLLYRGTPDNPGFWPRALFDLPFAAGKSYNLFLRRRRFSKYVSSIHLISSFVYRFFMSKFNIL